MQQVPGLTDAQRAALSSVELDQRTLRFFESLEPDRQLLLRNRVLELVNAGVTVDCSKFMSAGTLGNKAWKRALQGWRPS